MKPILVSIFLVSTLSMWSTARPQTATEVARPSTSVEVTHPQTRVPFVRPGTSVAVTHPVAQVQVLHPQTTVSVIHPVTTVEVTHPQTTVEVFHPQTTEFSSTSKANSSTANAMEKGKKGVAGTSAKAPTSMSDFKPKQAKDFTAGQKAAPMGGGDNKLGNETNVSEKDAANKSSLLGKQSNQNIDVDPKLTNLGGLGKSVEKKVEEKTKK